MQPLNPLLSIDKLCSLLKASGATVLVAWGAEDDSGYWSKAMALREQVPALRHVIHVAPVDGAGVQPLPAGIRDLDTLMATEPADHLVSGRHIGADEVCAYFHTGGTTGAPKLARHTHGAQVFMAWSYVQMQGLLPGDVAINGFPLFHVAGVLPGSLAALSAGVHVVIPTTGLFRNREVIRNYWKLVERYRATVLSGVSTVLTALTEVPLDGADISSLRYARTGAAPLTPELAARFTKLFGLHIYETYGMTETITHIAAKRVGEKAFTVLPDVTVSYDERNCLVIHAPKISDDVIVTNDIVELVNENQFIFLGRMDNVINSEIGRAHV